MDKLWCDFNDDDGFFDSDDSGGNEYEEEDDADYDDEEQDEEDEYVEEEQEQDDNDSIEQEALDGSGENLIPDTAVEEDYYEDDGNWTPGDYQASAERLFADNPYFGETIDNQLADEGFHHFEDNTFADAFEDTAPGSTDTVRLFEKDGQLHAFGFLPLAMMTLLRQQYSGIDFSNIRASLPLKGELAEPKPLPPAYAAIEPKPAVDLRPVCTPVGDQGDTSRCSAFAWTHALELSRKLSGQPERRLSPNYTMLQFQRLQGDAQDYGYAYEGGSGTISGTDPGEVLVENGTCRQELWPDHSEEPQVPERQLAADASQHRVPAVPHPIVLDDVKKALSANCPVHVGMNTGPGFMQVGRDGIISAAERASGRHGRHAMLLVGYNGNFFITKNSWGEQWGDRGYCYIPKNVLADSDAEFITLLPPVPHSPDRK